MLFTSNKPTRKEVEKTEYKKLQEEVTELIPSSEYNSAMELLDGAFNSKTQLKVAAYAASQTPETKAAKQLQVTDARLQYVAEQALEALA